MFGEIGTKATHDLRCYADTFLLKFAEHVGHIYHVVQHHRVGYQIPILDPLLLFDPSLTVPRYISF